MCSPSNPSIPATTSLAVAVVRTCKDGCNHQGLKGWERWKRDETGIAHDCTTVRAASSVSLAHLPFFFLPSIPKQTQSKPWKCNNDLLSCAKTWGRGGEKKKKEKRKWAAWNPVIFLCEPRCWYLIGSILSSSFKSPPTPSDPSRGPI